MKEDIKFLCLLYLLLVLGQCYQPSAVNYSIPTSVSTATQGTRAPVYTATTIAGGRSSPWHVVEGYDRAEPISLYFHSSQYGNFTCKPVVCTKQELKNGFGYFMAATSHENTFELLVFRVCRYLQTCIRHNHLFITLHHPSVLDQSNVLSDVYRRSEEFLSALAIPHNSWPGHFTSNTKMVHYLESLNGLNDPQKYIFHSDLDEIVDPVTLREAMTELRAGECDAIAGVWQDRVTVEGDLKRVELTQGEIEEQYPLRCSYSKFFMPERTTKKVIVYRSNLRLTSGQHEIWCNIGSDQQPGTKWKRQESCRAHVEARADKATKSSYILRLLPNFENKPRICKSVVVIDHYKFVAGVQQHLADRMVNYKSLGLVWWKQSMGVILIC